ncbi:MAG: DUF3320 domain-containing protein, partial [Candidatus Omnitrophica bacterium]|nr:DUF3320 domain-containing protein [Candidatus Omnitrophota bacterium]
MVNIVEERIKKWKDKLIDLSKRNRLLNFRPTKVTTIKITDELPTEILSLLAIENEGMEFLPVASSEDELFKESEDNKEIKEELSMEFQTYKKEELEQRYRDKYLQTDLAKEKLPKNLFRIYSKANSVIEEQGYNVLFLSLGCLEWYESEESNVKLKAPIILVPVELTRTSVRSKFKLKVHEEEPLILNPALILKMQNDFAITIEPIDEELENIDPQQIFSQIQSAIRKFDRWSVTNDIYLSLFSFAKFIMYKDIERFLSILLNNPVIRLICGQPGEQKVSLGLLLEQKELDKILTPHKTFQILDADSSQQQAILAVKERKNLVIEGPPGTGKSQTIANIISEFLADDKKVLFVSQKMAALEVVKKRLDNNGLGDFCLELHSRKANKNEVIKELVRVLEMQKKPDHSHDDEITKLEKLRNELNNYVKDIHTPFGKLEMTPYQAVGIINIHPEIQDIAFVFKDSQEWDRKKYDASCDLLDSLADILSKIHNPLEYPWYGSKLTSIYYQEKLRLKEVAESILNNYSILQDYIKQLAKETFFKEPSTIVDIEILIEANKLLQESPLVTKSILTNERWNSLSWEIEDIIKNVKFFNEFKAGLSTKYNIDKFISDNIEIDSLINRYCHYSKNPFLFLTSSFWRDRSLLKKYIIGKKYKPRIKEIIADLERIKEGKQTLEKINNNKLGSELFGEIWKGKDTDWESLDNFSKWMVKFRYYVIKKYFMDNVFEELEKHKIDKENSQIILGNLSSVLNKLKDDTKLFIELTKIDEILAFGAKYDEALLSGILKKINNMRNNIDLIEDWTRYQEILETCEEFGLKDFVNKVLSIKIPIEKIVDTFKCQFLRCWLDVAFLERASLKRFRGEDHEKLIQKFCELDKKQIELAKIRIQHKLSGKFDTTYTPSYTPSKGSELGILLRESRKTRAHMPIRKFFEQAPNVVINLKPCLMMSPLTVAQFLNPELIKFDLVIFDEASQIPPEDSIGAILRGRQVVIAGDSKQLPPTSFFQSEVITPEDEEGFTEETVDLDSILDECAVSGISRTMLRWHYRSKHESLIAFSNKHFYENHLFTFPCAEEECEHLGIKFHYLPSTSYDRGGSGTNVEEAREVAKAIFKHFREHPELSLGVGTFSIRQKYAIEDVIEEMLRQDNSLEVFFARDKIEHFFVKNLETIQGDERDVIFISVGYGKDPNGKLPMNFGPINQIGGARRLNVLVTRARKRLEIFSSIRGDDFDLSRTDSEGVHLLKHYLDFAEKGKSALLREADTGGFLESPFEESVYNLLVNKGLKVRKQVGCSGYRIDLAIIDDDRPGRYVLGIECDGAHYHSSATARDRDRLREQVLEDLNWNIYRIWSTDWFKNPRLEFEKLINVIEKAKRGEFYKKKLKVNSGYEIQYRNPTSKRNNLQIKDYSLTPIHKTLASENFYLSDTSKICSILKKVVEYEGPVHKDEAERRVVQHWGIRAVGSRIREILGEAEHISVSEKMIKKKGNFYWPVDMEKPVVRRRDSMDVNKNIEFIALEEIGEAALLALETEYSMPKDNLIEQTANLLGFDRVTEDISKYIWEAIKKYKKEHKITEVNDRLILVKEKIVSCSTCGQKLKFPDKNIEITCPKCKTSFTN